MDLMKCILPWWGMGDSKRKNADSLESAFSWQGQKDSNPQQRFWRPTCYHYTMPLCSFEQGLLYRNSSPLSIPKFDFLTECSLQCLLALYSIEC